MKVTLKRYGVTEHIEVTEPRIGSIELPKFDAEQITKVADFIGTGGNVEKLLALLNAISAAVEGELHDAAHSLNNNYTIITDNMIVQAYEGDLVMADAA